MPTEHPALPSSELPSGAFQLSETGLVASGDPTIEQWLEVGAFINKSQRAVHFWIGDWLNYGEKRWGDRYTEALKKTKYDYQTLRNDKWVSSRIPLERRKPTLSFDHHQQVAELPPDEQDDLLAEAVAQNLNSERFRKLIRQREAPLADRSLSGAPDKHSPAQELIQRMVQVRIDLLGIEVDTITPEERAMLADQCTRLTEVAVTMVDEITTYENDTADSRP